MLMPSDGCPLMPKHFLNFLKVHLVRSSQCCFPFFSYIDQLRCESFEVDTGEKLSFFLIELYARGAMSFDALEVESFLYMSQLCVCTTFRWNFPYMCASQSSFKDR